MKCYIDSVEEVGINVNGTTVTIPLGNTGTIASGSLISTNITLTDITNPITLKLTSSFEVELMNGGDVI